MLALTGGFAFVAYRFWSAAGLFGALIGGIFSYQCLTETELIISTAYDQSLGVFVHDAVGMGFFAYVPVVLVGLNLIMTLKKR
jgi:hypothetical protein